MHTDDHPEWGSELKEAAESLDEALVLFEDLLGKEPSARLLQARTDVENAREAVEAAWNRYAGEPTRKLLDARRLTREEFYVLVSGGFVEGAAKQLTGAPVDDYELFDLLCYDDGKRTCYINPAMRPSDGKRKTKMQVGSAPEDLDWEGLREEQQVFFSQFDPELAARFRRP